MKRMLSLVVMLMVIGQVQFAGAIANQYVAIKESVTIPVSGAVNSTVTGSVNAVQSGTWVIATVTARGWALSAANDSVDVTPASPAGTDYLPVRLSDGTVFYNAKDRNWNLATSTDKVEVEVSKSVAMGRTWQLSNTTDNVLFYGWDGSSNQKIKTDAQGQVLAVVQSQAASSEKNTVVSISSLGAGLSTSGGTITLSAGQILVLEGFALSSEDFPYMVTTVRKIVGTTTPTVTDLGQVAITPSSGSKQMTFEREWTIAYNTEAVNGRCDIFVAVTNKNSTDAASAKVTLMAYIK